MKYYQKLVAGFDALQKESFSNKMKSWEAKRQPGKAGENSGGANVRRLRPIFVRLAAAAVVLLLIGVGMQQYMQSQYSNKSLVSAYYQDPGTKNVMLPDAPTDSSVVLQRFEAIHDKLKKDDFAGAIPEVKSLLDDLSQTDLDQLTRQYYQENLEWNYALALLGAGRNDQEVADALNMVIKNDDHEYRDQALELKGKLSSFWR